MCGRYTLRRAALARAVFEALRAPMFDEFSERPRYNVAPSQNVPVVRLSSDARELVPMRWGLIPTWTQGKPKVAPINARCESVATSGMFREAFRKRRCLVPADGFYEWQGAKSPKQPYFIHRRDDALLAFAGLWERWKPQEDAEPIDTFTIITTSANELMKGIHDRMPVIVDPAHYDRWLKQGDEELLKPCPPEAMEAYAVSTKVNRPAHDSPDCIERV